MEDMGVGGGRGGSGGTTWAVWTRMVAVEVVRPRWVLDTF